MKLSANDVREICRQAECMAEALVSSGDFSASELVVTAHRDGEGFTVAVSRRSKAPRHGAELQGRPGQVPIYVCDFPKVGDVELIWTRPLPNTKNRGQA